MDSQESSLVAMAPPKPEYQSSRVVLWMQVWLVRLRGLPLLMVQRAIEAYQRELQVGQTRLPMKHWGLRSRSQKLEPRLVLGRSAGNPDNTVCWLL
jgi:hypothetical protein